MSIRRILLVLGSLALSPLMQAQTAPTAYTISEVSGGTGTSAAITVYRNGTKAVQEVNFPAQAGGMPAHRTVTFYDLKEGTTYSWDPADTPPACGAGTFSGDWGDPFSMTAELSEQVAKGILKPTGTETIGGVATKVFEGASAQGKIKAWLDQKDGLVMRAQFAAPGTTAMQTLVDITKVSLTPPPASVFTLPASCAGVHREPTEAERFAAETGDSGSNFVNANYGPGSKNSCSVVLRVLHAGDMAPISRFQVAVDLTYNMDNPAHYETGVGRDGTETFSGGGIREITNQIQNGMVRIDNPPAYFGLDVNLIKPGYGSGLGLIYRQCFAPQTVLLYVVKNPEKPSEGGDWLWVKSGKYAAVPASH